MENRTIAEDTAGAILEKSVIVKLNGKEYHAPRVTLATLIDVSRILSTIPNIEVFDLKQFISEKDNVKIEENILKASKSGLFYAKECEIVGFIIATLILGYKKRRGLLKWIYEHKRIRLALKLMNDCPLEELISETNRLINGLDAARFFVFIASLSEINMMREAMTTTQSGQ